MQVWYGIVFYKIIVLKQENSSRQKKIYKMYIMQGGEHSDSWGEPSHKSNSRLLEAHRLLWVLFSNFKLTLYTEPFQFSEEYVES